MKMRFALFALLAGCAGAEAMTLPPPAATAVAPANDVGLHPGESMSFEVRLGGVLAGEAQLAVGEIGEVDGHRAVVVKSRAATAGAAALLKNIVDEATTTIDLTTGRPLLLDTRVVNGDKSMTTQTTFTGSIANVTYLRDAETTPHGYRIDFGAVTVHDTHSAMAQMRGWKATPGTTRSVFVVGGRRLWRVDMRYVGIETIASSVGNRRAVRLDGSSYHAKQNLSVDKGDKAQRTFSVWLSDDGDRVPLRVTAKTELGEVAMELAEYNRP